MNLRAKALESIRWTGASMMSRILVNFIQVMILARILTPYEFGVQAIAMGFIAIAMTMSDLGVSSAIIHYSNITRRQSSSLYWINLLVGTAIAGSVLGLSGYISSIYNRPELAKVMQLLAVSFIFTASAQQFRILAEKELKFKTLSLIEIISSFVGICVAVSVALFGHKIYALSLAYVANVSIFAALAWVFLSRGHIPLFVFAWAETRKFINFGLVMVGVSASNSVGAQADLIITGRIFPVHDVGLYAQPRDLTTKLAMMINPIITRVGLPLVSAAKADKNLVGKVYRNTILMTATVNFPIFAFLALYAPEVIRIYLGPQWGGASEFLRATALWAMVRCIGNPIGSLLVGTGRVRHALVSSLIVTVGVVITAYTAGRFFGLLSVPYALAGFYAAIIVPFWALNVRPASGLGLKEYISQLARPGLAVSFACVAAGCSTWAVDSLVLRLMLGAIVGGLAYASASIIVNRDAVRAIVGLIPIVRFRDLVLNVLMKTERVKL